MPFSPLNVKTTSHKLARFFENVEKLHLLRSVNTAFQSDAVFQSDAIFHLNSGDIVSFLNPLHPYLIHLVGKNESDYLNTLSNSALVKLIDQLNGNNAMYLIFENKAAIPQLFFQQTHLQLIISDLPLNILQRQLTQDINKLLTQQSSQHGAFVVVFNQGILITGNSGSGKSSLLLNLIQLGHLWVADDLSLFHKNHDNKIIGQASGELSEFVHIKGLGPLNVDKIHGQACRIRSHSLAAVIHLSDNNDTDNKNLSAYTQNNIVKILGKPFPMWQFPMTHTNLTLMVENCAKCLILDHWGYSAINGLENALNKVLTAPETMAKSAITRQT